MAHPARGYASCRRRCRLPHRSSCTFRRASARPAASSRRAPCKTFSRSSDRWSATPHVRTDLPSSPPTAERTRRTRSRPPGAPSHLPVLIPRGVGADALALHLHVDHIGLVFTRGLVDAALERRLELLQGLDGLALAALRAGAPRVVGGRRAEVEPGRLAG